MPPRKRKCTASTTSSHTPHTITHPTLSTCHAMHSPAHNHPFNFRAPTLPTSHATYNTTITQPTYPPPSFTPHTPHTITHTPSLCTIQHTHLTTSHSFSPHPHMPLTPHNPAIHNHPTQQCHHPTSINLPVFVYDATSPAPPLHASSLTPHLPTPPLQPPSHKHPQSQHAT